MTMYQYGFPAVSVPFGGGGKGKQQWVEYEWENLERFETIYLCMDMDEGGQIAVAELINRLGRHRCRIVSLPHKDANECLKQGVTKKEIDLCFNQAKLLDPEELKPASSFQRKTEKLFFPDGGIQLGVALPWDKTKDKILFRPAEVSIWTGINGHGKSLILNFLSIFAGTQGYKTCIASLEVKPEKTLGNGVRQLVGHSHPNLEEVDMAFRWYDGKFWLFDLVGSAKVEKILEVFRYAYHRYGIKQFVIDSLMRCGINEDDFNAQKAFVDTLVDFVHEIDCHVHLVAHSRKGMNEEHQPGKLDVKGTGAITDLAHNTFSMWRNKKKEEALSDMAYDPAWIDKPDAILLCDKQKNGEWEGRIGLFFDRGSLQYLESQASEPMKFIHEDYDDEWSD